jgi:hypothetical protein
LVVVPNANSQPFAALPSQLPKPVLQLPMAQLPVLQVAVALARLQPVPHVPQSVVVVVGVSQPLAKLLSQLAKPLLQLPNVQVPLGHVSLALAKSHS